MASQWLKEITEINGVEGVYIVSNHGKIIEQVGLNVKEIVLEGIAIHLLRIISAYHLKKSVVTEIEVMWNNYHVIARNSNQFVVITFCSSVKALSLLRITMNVIISHLVEDRKFLKKVKKHAMAKTYVLRRGNLDEFEVSLISKLQ